MERLTKIQVGLRVTKDKSGDKGRFKFRSAEDIFEKLKPLLEETKTAVVVSDELVEVGGRLAIKATASLMCTSNSGILASATGYALYDKHEIVKKDTGEVISTMSNEQCTGSASSYARKYALCGLFAIDNDENDPDQPTIKKYTPEQEKPAKPAAQPKPKQQTMVEAPAAKKQEQPQQKTYPLPPLSDEENEQYLEFMSDISSADTIAAIEANVTLAIGQKFEDAVRRAAAKKGIAIATNRDELNHAYEFIKDREGWQEIKIIAMQTAIQKGFATKKPANEA